MSMSGATMFSILVVSLIPVIIGFLAAGLDQYHAWHQGNHKR